MGMDVYGKNASDETGDYFRSNIWGWPPILSIAMTANETHGLGFDMSAWSFNDGAGLDTQEDCTRLADAMESLLTMEDETIETKPHDAANALCKALGMQAPTSAATSKEHAVEFVNFLRHCGGFNIY